ncbi:MAG: hypothetical protein HW421_579 [Ignavibacteria bacterium]|nr:hypothetical protein [Ignavibacteria bacterium]
MKQKLQAKVSSKDEKKFVKQLIKPPKDLPISIVLIIFAVTTAIFFWGHLAGTSFFWEDFVEYIYPTQSFAAAEFARGVIPFWNPYTFAGMPFLADLQVGFFYPFNRILSLFVDSNGWLSVGWLQFIIILHFFIAQTGMYLLCREHKLSSIGSMISSVSYSFSMILVCHVIHPMIVEHLAWLPFIILFFSKGIKSRRIRLAVIAGLLLGMSFLSGHPQMTLYEMLLIGFLFLWELVLGLKNKEIAGAGVIRFLLCGIIPIIISVGIFAIQYLPSKELATLSQRNELTYEKSSEGSLEFKQLFCSISPNLFGSVNPKENSFSLKSTGTDGSSKDAPYYYYWETAYYFGIAALLLGLFGTFTQIKNRFVIFLVIISGFGVIFALGSNGFLYSLFFNLPLFGSFRNPSRMIFFTVFAMSILAGFGFDALWNSGGERKTILKFSLISIGLIFISFLASTGSLHSAFESQSGVLSASDETSTITLFFAIVIFVFGYLAAKGKIKIEIVGGLIFIIAFVDLLFISSEFISSKQDPKKSYAVEPELKQLFKPNPPKEIFRINARMYNPSYSAMMRNQGLLDKIMMLEGYNPLRLEKVIPPDLSRNELNALYNVKYQIDLNPDRQPVFNKRDLFFQRAWLLHNAIIIPEKQVFDEMKKKHFDLSVVAILEEQPDVKLPGLEPDSSDVVECLDYQSNSFKYKVNSQNAGILCFSEIWYPAWKPYIDGKPAKLLRLDYCLRAVALDRGIHTVEMRYESETFKTGAYITLFTLILSIILIFIPIRKNKE